MKNEKINSCFVFSHVMLPKDLARLVPKSHLMTESEWRAIGVQQSRGWVSSKIPLDVSECLLMV